MAHHGVWHIKNASHQIGIMLRMQAGAAIERKQLKLCAQ